MTSIDFTTRQELIAGVDNLACLSVVVAFQGGPQLPRTRHLRHGIDVVKGRYLQR